MLETARQLDRDRHRVRIQRQPLHLFSVRIQCDQWNPHRHVLLAPIHVEIGGDGGDLIDEGARAFDRHLLDGLADAIHREALRRRAVDRQQHREYALNDSVERHVDPIG